MDVSSRVPLLLFPPCIRSRHCFVLGLQIFPQSPAAVLAKASDDYCSRPTYLKSPGEDYMKYYAEPQQPLGCARRQIDAQTTSRRVEGSAFAGRQTPRFGRLDRSALQQSVLRCIRSITSPRPNERAFRHRFRLRGYFRIRYSIFCATARALLLGKSYSLL
jgi:hypothetical protein